MKIPGQKRVYSSTCSRRVSSLKVHETVHAHLAVLVDICEIRPHGGLGLVPWKIVDVGAIANLSVRVQPSVQCWTLTQPTRWEQSA